MLAHRFRQLDCLLTAERRWWQYQPYHHLGIAFAREAPALAKCLAALTLDE
ncbi:methyltransferase, partial [Aeromonas sp. CPF2-S1]|nr:methyltransferase [Aeromonas sp. CPF2-S1]